MEAELLPLLSVLLPLLAEAEQCRIPTTITPTTSP
jgi:hypothetical protein